MGLVKRCELCGKKIMGMRILIVNKGTPEEYCLHPECGNTWMKTHGLFSFPTTKAGFHKKQNSEVRVKCNTCGHVYCYNIDDIKRNNQLAKQAVTDSIIGAGQAIGGTIISSQVAQMSANSKLNQIVDYTRCPKCNSTDIKKLTDEAWEIEKKAKQNISAPVQQTASPAEELKKFKELLDMGAITQEEFDSKKKQILGL